MEPNGGAESRRSQTSLERPGQTCDLWVDQALVAAATSWHKACSSPLWTGSGVLESCLLSFVNSSSLGATMAQAYSVVCEQWKRRQTPVDGATGDTRRVHPGETHSRSYILN